MKEATIAKKIEQVEKVSQRITDSVACVFVDYLGLTVDEVSKLRTKLYNDGCDMKVIKNNILRRAAKMAGYDGLDEILVGPSAVAFSKDATSMPKIMFDFAKKNDKLKIKAGIIDGRVVNDKELKVLSALPNKEGMLSMLLSVLQAPIRNLACVVKAVSEKEV